MKKIAIIIVNWNEPKATIDCLASIHKLLKLNKLDYKVSIIVVDNGSKDNSVRLIQVKFPNVFLLKNKINLGFARAVNIALKDVLKKDFDVVMLLNNDTVIKQKTFFNTMINELYQNNEIGIIGPVILDEKQNIWSAGGVIDPWRYSGGHITKLSQKTSPVDFVSGCCMFIKTEVFKKTGMFDERFYLYYEDVDFCLRAKKAHYKSMITSKAEIIHSGSHTSRKDFGKMDYYLARGRLLLMYKHASLIIGLREFLRLPKTLAEMVFGKERNHSRYKFLGMKDFLIGRFNKSNLWS
ncbi:glycosyltransferase family 2 protein [Patescibacteria group bacterium]|nr:glycosyltransferase family 2 protein [Patescibacteria group bacterium]MBU1931560.1 glycosyltransferase family 2 protein [Patescibacteria group bacterium]